MIIMGCVQVSIVFESSTDSDLRDLIIDLHLVTREHVTLDVFAIPLPYYDDLAYALRTWR